jgi:hypothetical protein
MDGATETTIRCHVRAAIFIGVGLIVAVVLAVDYALVGFSVTLRATGHHCHTSSAVPTFVTPMATTCAIEGGR